MVRTERFLGLYLLIPTLLVIGAIFVWPLGYAVWVSFTSKHLLRSGEKLVGLANYVQVLQSGSFWHSLRVGVLWTVSVVFFQVAVGLGTALLLHETFFARSTVRGLFVFPYMVPPVVAATVWRWIFNDMYGTLNYFLLSTGLASSRLSWLGDPQLAMPAVVIANVWQYFPFATLCFLARLTAIPIDLYEAARVDGASAWKRFTSITMPQMWDVFTLVLLLRGIWMFNNFQSIYLYTQGGPLRSTEHVPILIYRDVFDRWKLSLGAAEAVLAMLILFGVASIYLWLMRFGRQETA